MSRTPKNVGVSGAPPQGRPIFAVCAPVIRQTEGFLRVGLWGATEKVAYWAGVKRDDVWVATTVIRPDAVLRRGSFHTTPAANAEVVAFIAKNGLALLAQVHTHPGTGVDHSEGDDRDAFMPTENYISIVVPKYCRDGMLPLERCGVHRYEQGVFRRIVGTELARSICVVPLTKDFKP